MNLGQRREIEIAILKRVLLRLDRKMQKPHDPRRHLTIQPGHVASARQVLVERLNHLMSLEEKG